MATLRLATEADAGGVQEIYAPIVTDTLISFEYEVPSPDEMAFRIRATVPAFPFLVCDDGGTIAGYAYGARLRSRPAYDWSVETSVYVAPEYRRSRIGTALYVALLEMLAGQGFVDAFAVISLPNPGSVTFHEGLGFRPAGVWKDAGYKLGRWCDIGWWRRPLREPPADPDPPVGFLAYHVQPQCREALETGARHLTSP